MDIIIIIIIIAGTKANFEPDTYVSSSRELPVHQCFGLNPVF